MNFKQSIDGRHAIFVIIGLELCARHQQHSIDVLIYVRMRIYISTNVNKLFERYAVDILSMGGLS